MTLEDVFMVGLVLFFAIPVFMVGWSLTIEWYLETRCWSMTPTQILCHPCTGNGLLIFLILLTSAWHYGVL
jgi:hypothetical protein